MKLLPFNFVYVMKKYLDSEYEIISIANRNSKDTLLKQVIVDADTNETLNIFIDAINKLEE